MCSPVYKTYKALRKNWTPRGQSVGSRTQTTINPAYVLILKVDALFMAREVHLATPASLQTLHSDNLKQTI